MDGGAWYVLPFQGIRCSLAQRRDVRAICPNLKDRDVTDANDDGAYATRIRSFFLSSARLCSLKAKAWPEEKRIGTTTPSSHCLWEERIGRMGI